MERAVLLFFILALYHSGVRVVAAVSVDASFDDPRCEMDERVCPNDPLLFTCTVTGSDDSVASVTLPSEQFVIIRSDNSTASGEEGLPGGVRVVSHDAIDSGVVNYTLTLVIDRASILNGNNVTCADGSRPPLTAQAPCPVATAPQEPVNVRQMNSTNTESSAVVQWRAPVETGGVSISTYTVTVNGEGMMVSQMNVTDDGSNMFTHTISGLEYNTDYEVEVTAINSCGIPSQPATITVFINASAPPQPTSPEVMMNCSVPVSAGRTVVISWMEGEQLPNVVYPEEEDVIVTLTPRDIVCQNETDTRCSATIRSEDNYTASIKLNNSVGSSIPVNASFSSSILYAETDLNLAIPRVTAVVNTSLCIDNVNMFQVNFLFGVGKPCVPNSTRLVSPTIGMSRTSFDPPLPLNSGDSYCFTLRLIADGMSVAEVNGSGVVVAPTCCSGTPVNTAAIAGIVVGGAVLILCIVVVVVVLIVCVIKKKQGLKKKSTERDQDPDTIQRTAHPETGEMYTMVDLNKRNRELEQAGATALYQDPSTIQHQEGPSGDVYAMPQKTGKKKKKKEAEAEVEAEVEEMSEEQKAALYSVPDRKGQKSKSEGLEYAQLDIQPSVKQAPPSKGSTYVDIRY